MWEYKTVYRGCHEINSTNMSHFLNTNGKEGWELVHIISKPAINQPNEFANHTFVFKRPVK